MGVRILVGREQGDNDLASEQAVLFDSVTGFAFGPLFSTGEDGEPAEDRAQGFLNWLATADGRDARSIPSGELEAALARWAHQGGGW